MDIRSRISSYTEDPILNKMWSQVRSCPPLRSMSVDITHRCNLRCTGCYFFSEGMESFKEKELDELTTFIEQQKAKGITFATVLGGEPALVPEKLALLAENFNLMIVTNGSRPIPKAGLENVAIAVSMWGDKENDIILRGNGRQDIFSKGLVNFKNDERAIWYITLPSNPAPATEQVVDECVANGNLVAFNYYGDLEDVGGNNDHTKGFEAARNFVNRMIEKYPNAIAFNGYLNDVITSGKLMDEKWGYDVCGSISVDNPINAQRLQNGNSYNPYFNAYLPDLKSTRRCCVGESRDCSTCYDVWSHVSWVAMNMEKHLYSKQSFFDWLATMYMFYGTSRLIDGNEFKALLPLIHSWKNTPSEERLSA